MKQADRETNLAKEESPEGLFVQLGSVIDQIKSRFRLGSGDTEPGSWEQEGMHAVGEDVSGDDESSSAAPEFSDPSEDDEASEDQAEESPTQQAVLSKVVYQLPVVLSDPIELGVARLKKPLLPVGKQINYERDGVKKVIDFSPELLSKMAKNVKRKAFDNVPLLAWHPDSSKVRPEDYFGELVDAEVDDKWLWGVFDLTERGAQLVSDNPNLPTSVGYDEKYHRKGDDKKFGPSIFHVATTYRPAVPGLGGWVPVELSDEAEVVDLTEAKYLDQTRKEADSVSEVETPEIKQEEVKVTEESASVVSLEEFNALKEELEVKLAEERKARQATALELEEQRVDKRLETEFAKVIPAFRDEVKPIILSSAKGTEIQLSEGDDTESLGERMWRILTMVRDSDKQGKELTYELGEVTRGDVEPTTGDPETDLGKRIDVLMAEKEIDYGKAFELALKEVSA